MTESIITPSDIQQYWNSRDRVKNWVHANTDAVFASPNVPPSELSDLDDVLSSPPSEVESSHSIPPALMLKYPDGREIPIPRLPRVNPSLVAPGSKHSHSHSSSSKSRSPIDPSSPQHRSRSGSNPSGRSFRYPDLHEREKLRSHSPEEIRILPSESPSQTQSGSDRARAPIHLSSQQNRSRSLPRDTFSPTSQDHDPMPLSPISPQGPYSSHHSPSHSHHHSNSSPVQLQHTPQLMHASGLARSQPIPWQHHAQGPYPPNGMRPDYTPPSRSHFKHSPPSIVYAPSHNRTTSNYQPPMIFSHPPNVGPNGMMYSHSVPPTQARHPQTGQPSQPSSGPLYHGRMPIPEEMRPRTRDGDRERERERDRDRARDRDRSVDREHWGGERERDRTHSRNRSKSNSSRHSPKKERSEKSSSSWGKSSTRTRSGRDRSRSLPLEQDMPMPGPVPHGHKHSHSRYARPPSPAESAGSGSTYYVLPNGRQKVHVLQPSSLPTATSTTKSPMTPVSPTGSLKKSFIQRMLGGLAGRFSASGSAKGSIDGSHPRLHRRHSISTHSSGRAGH